MSDGPTTPATPWQDAWFDAARHQSMTAWRGVESQHGSSTLKLVDSREEHDLLEEMLEASKPAVPIGGERLHYLLFTPFRYASPHASRFRKSGEGGIWYGADSVEAACAEIAYWRHRFILDSAGLVRQDTELVTVHTVFAADVRGTAIDLTSPPWSSCTAIWTDPQDYTGTQHLAVQARHRAIGWIRYLSVRHPGAQCAAVLTVDALAETTPRDFQAWTCRATRHRVLFYSRAQAATHSWDF